MDSDGLENLWFATRYRTLSPVAEEQLRLASLSYANDAKAEMHLALARAVAPDNPVVRVGEYRYYFYKGRLSEALGVAEACLLLRLNRIAEGALAAEKLLELDPGNKIGGQVLLDVLERVGKDDYDD